MIIYELTNKLNADKSQIPMFSKFYATKEDATKMKQDHTKVFKHDFKSLGREEIAMILSMGHISIYYDNGWQEVHEVSSLVKSSKEVK
jgi:hypothetical protein